MDGMGWDGLDLRVGGGIEHLTVLINYYYYFVSICYPPFSHPLIHVARPWRRYRSQRKNDVKIRLSSSYLDKPIPCPFVCHYLKVLKVTITLQSVDQVFV